MPWQATPEDCVCNGDMIVRTGKGSLVAVIYAAPTEEETQRRVQAILSADPDHSASPSALRAALTEIAHLRPAGDIDTATGTRALLKQIECIALEALAKERSEQVPA